MKSSEIKKIILKSLDPETDTSEIAVQMENNGISFDFNEGFTANVLDKLTEKSLMLPYELEYRQRLNRVFYRIAFTGVAAIIILMISIFIAQDSLSFNSLLGMGDTYDETIVCLLTGI